MNKPEIQEIFVSWFCMATKLGKKDFFDIEDCAKGMERNDMGGWYRVSQPDQMSYITQLTSDIRSTMLDF